MSRSSTGGRVAENSNGGLIAEAAPVAGIPHGVEPGGAPVPGGIRIRQRLRTARVVLPAVAAALAAFWFGGIDGDAAIRAAVFALVIVAGARLLRSFPYPLQLIPASRMAVALMPVAAGGLLLAVLGVGESSGSLAGGVIAGLVAGGLVAIAVELVGSRLLTTRPLRIAVLGAADFVPAIRRELDAIGGRREVEVVGWLNLGARYTADDESAKAETLGRVRAAITEHDIDLLVRGPGSGASRSGRDVYNTIAAGCLDLPVRMIDGNQLYEQLFGHVPIGTIDSAWFLFLMHPSFQASSKASKRALDLVVGSLAALLSLPAVAVGALAIKLNDGGPVFYRQRRVGEQGQEFEILKLRTMSVDSQSTTNRWSGAGDVRVTRVGRVLRRLHVDELPQVVNVLRGDMTLVGPRPEQPQITAELERVFPHYSRRLLVKPGVTGWAQVRCGYAGSELGTAWKLCHDLFYLKHRSILVDMLIMLETIVIAARDSHRPMRAPQAEFLFRGEGLSEVDPHNEARPDAGDRPIPEIPLDSPFGAPVGAGATAAS
jgi:lipopolysaccharide/colanic/teichoic acid biosynthesis glycosyltransferase